MHARWSDGTSSKDIRQDGGALHVLDDQRDHGQQLILAERVAESAGPVNIVDRRMSVLK